MHCSVITHGSKITFVAVDPDNEETITLMSNDQKLRLKRCHAFVTTKKAAQLIPACVNQGIVFYLVELCMLTVCAGFKIHTGSADHPATKKDEKRLRRQLSSVKKVKIMSRKSSSDSVWASRKVEKGELLHTYPCKYLGTAHVASSGAGECRRGLLDPHDPPGPHVAEAETRIKKNNSSQNANIMIYSSRFELVMEGSDETTHSAPLFDVTYSALDDSRTQYTYVINGGTTLHELAYHSHNICRLEVG